MADIILLAKIRSIFSAAANRVNLVSGEDLEVSLGKISKWLSDLKTVAFTGSYNDLTDKPTIPSSAVTGVKGNSESNYRTGNVNITKSNIGLGSVENKSSATIRSEITSSNVTSALGYTPVNKAGDTMTGDLHFSDGDSASLDIGYDSSPDLFKIWSLNKDIDIEGGNVYICGGSGNGVVIDGAVFFKGTLSSSGATDIRVLAIDVNNSGKLMKLNNSELTDKVLAVRYDTSSQGLTTTQKSNARTNLGLGTAATYSYGSFATSTQGRYATDFNSNFKPIFTTSGQSHASVFRGKYLGSSFTSAQKVAITNGTFDDLYIGDYWTINSTDWVIADIDYYYGIGDTACWTHHLVIVPRYMLLNSTMNASSTSSGGYNSSKMRTSTLLCNSTTAGNTSTVYGKICAAFGSNYILSHRVLVSTSVDSSGNVSGWAWSDSIVDLLNQSQVSGQKVSSNGYKDVYNVGVQTAQLAVFRINHGFMIAQSGTTRTGYWLSDVRSATSFALVYANGAVDSNGASNSYSVRPHFCLKGV